MQIRETTVCEQFGESSGPLVFSMAPEYPEDNEEQFVILVGNMELVGCDLCGSWANVPKIRAPFSQNVYILQ